MYFSLPSLTCLSLLSLLPVCHLERHLGPCLQNSDNKVSVITVTSSRVSFTIINHIVLPVITLPNTATPLPTPLLTLQVVLLFWHHCLGHRCHAYQQYNHRYCYLTVEISVFFSSLRYFPFSFTVMVSFVTFFVTASHFWH